MLSPIIFNNGIQNDLNRGEAHAAAHPDAMAEYGFDFIVPGKGEIPLIEFLTRLLTESIDSIKETPFEGLGV